jgi:hypothetical protein
VWLAWGAENDEIEVPKKSAETGGHRCHISKSLSSLERKREKEKG